ncbi:MAG TPA: c-type cytochrome, partial [Polyangia bacterium]|nr:c-type cytochrome [Polyangia bacterium]
RAEMADGSARLTFTCATCHAASANGSLVVGLANASLDLGAWLADGLDSAPPSPSSPLSVVDASLLRLWGPGRIDAVTASGRLPVAIPDLRPIRWLTHLHHEGNLLQVDRQALAIRLETLIITSHGESLRPPREITLGLAHYLWTLAAALPDKAAQNQRGHDAFAAGRCSACHAGPGMTGPPVDVAIVGTDPIVARDPDRGTGHYRVPSLRGVGSRGILLHDGSFRSLETMFDPRRRAGTAAPAHPFGLGLPDSQRVDLIDFLRAL